MSKIDARTQQLVAALMTGSLRMTRIALAYRSQGDYDKAEFYLDASMRADDRALEILNLNRLNALEEV